jgi:signal peptidase II
MPKGKRKNISFFLLFIFILFFDRLTKSYILSKLSPHQSIPIIKNIFHFTLVYNTGIAFGIFKNNNGIFILISFIIILLILKNLRDKSQNKIFKLALVMIIAGALGNLWDRIYFGYVIDFLDLRIWPVFNIADTSISFGIILILYNTFIKKS